MSESTPQQIGVLIPELMRDIGSVGKNRKNNHQNYNFRGIDDVLNFVGPAVAKAGLRVEVDMSEYLSDRVEWEDGGRRKFRMHVSLKLTARFTAPDGSQHVCAAYGEGQDTSGDKATNKAMSAAFKYAFFLGLVIPVEGVLDESDNDKKQEDAPAKAKAKPAAKKAAPDANSMKVKTDPSKWADWEVPFGKIKGTTLGTLAIEGRIDELTSMSEWMKTKLEEDPNSKFAGENRAQINLVTQAIANCATIDEASQELTADDF